MTEKAPVQSAKADSYANQTPVNKFRIRVLSAVGILCFFTYTTWTDSLPPLRAWIEARSWEKTSCTILSAESVRKERYEYIPTVKFAYDFNGRRYQAEGHSLELTSYRDIQKVKGFLDRFPAKSKTVCFVNPKKPDQAVLDRSLRLGKMFPLIILILVFLFLLTDIVTFIRQKNTPPNPFAFDPKARPWPSDFEPLPASRIFHHAPALFMDDLLGWIFKEIAALVISLIFLYFLSLTVRLAAHSVFGYIPLLAVSTFLLISLLFFLGIMIQFPRLFHPKVGFALGPVPILPGARLTFQWYFDGPAHKIQELEIVLEEKIRSEKDQKVDFEQPKAKLTVIKTDKPLEIQAGTATADIPDTLVVRPEKYWYITFQGKVKDSMDLNQGFEVQSGLNR